MNKDNFMQRPLFLFGAGVRGRLFGTLLESRNIRKFSFIDNDRQRINQTIGGHVIYSLQEIKKIKDCFIVITPQNPTEIVKQLELEGKEKTIDYICTSLNKTQLFKEFRQKKQAEFLFFGETQLNVVPIIDTELKSIRELLAERLGKTHCRILSESAMGMRCFYYLFLMLLIEDRLPEHVVLFVNFEILTSYHHLLARAAHASTLKMILESSFRTCDELEEYIREASEIESNYRMEALYSPERYFDGTQKEKDIIYFRKSIMDSIDESTVEIEYMHKILVLAKKQGIKALVVLLPVNSTEGKEFEPEFEKIYNRKRDFLKEQVISEDAGFMDLSGLLEKNDFVNQVTINDAIYYNGRKRIVDCVCNYLQKG